LDDLAAALVADGFARAIILGPSGAGRVAGFEKRLELLFERKGHVNLGQLFAALE
jgi:hypothetical protein